jgi:hypothetical protein
VRPRKAAEFERPSVLVVNFIVTPSVRGSDDVKLFSHPAWVCVAQNEMPSGLSHTTPAGTRSRLPPGKNVEEPDGGVTWTVRRADY